ncbi:MAG: restriction endonuclease subunit S [Spirosomataceae bacterium]
MSFFRIDEIFNFEKGVLQSSKCVPGEYDFITASSDWKTHNEYTHDCEALIFAAAASGSLGRTHYVNGKFISSDLCFIITPKDQENLPVDLKFYHILFNELKDEIVRNTKAGTSKEAIGLGSFGKYKLPYFDIDTQIEIKNRFVNAEELKSELSSELLSQVDLVKKLRQQLLQDAVQGKLVEQNPKDEPASELLKKIKAEKVKLIAEKKLKKEKELPPIKAEEIPFEIPDNWVWCRLGEVCTFISGNNFNSEDFKKEEGVKCIKITNAGVRCVIETDDFLPLNFKEKHKQYLVYKNDLILALTRPYIADGLKISKCPDSYNESLLNQRVAVIRSTKFINNDYVYSFLGSDFVLNIYKGMFEGKGQQPNLKKEDVTELLIPLPPLSEQIRIVQKLDELMQHCNELEASIKESKSQNEKLLQQVLREALRKEEVEA